MDRADQTLTSRVVGSAPDRPPVHDGKEVGMRRMIAAIAVATALLAMSVPASAAGPPTIIKFPKGTFDLGNLNQGPAGRVCPFPVGVVVKGRTGARDLLRRAGRRVRGHGVRVVHPHHHEPAHGREREREQSGPGSLDGNGVPVIGRGRGSSSSRSLRVACATSAASRGSCRRPYGVHGIPIAGIEEDSATGSPKLDADVRGGSNPLGRRMQARTSS